METVFSKTVHVTTSLQDGVVSDPEYRKNRDRVLSAGINWAKETPLISTSSPSLETELNFSTIGWKALLSQSPAWSKMQMFIGWTRETHEHCNGYLNHNSNNCQAVRMGYSVCQRPVPFIVMDQMHLSWEPAR